MSTPGANLWHTATINAFNTTLNGNIAAGDASIALTSVVGLNTTGGILTVDRINATTGQATSAVREYIAYAGITGNTLTGCIRGLGGSNAQSHSSNAVVEETFTITHWNDLISVLANIFTVGGALDTTKIMDLSTAQTATNKSFTSPTFTGTIPGSPTFSGKPIFAATQPTLIVDSDATTVTFNMNSGAWHQVTLGGNRTLAVSNVATPQVFILQLKQDATGSRTVSWFGGINWAGGTAPTLTTTASKTDTFGFLYDGSTYWGFVIGQNA